MKKLCISVIRPYEVKPFRLDWKPSEVLLLESGGELHVHAVEFFHDHAVLARDVAAHHDADLQDYGAEQFVAVQLVFLPHLLDRELGARPARTDRSSSRYVAT